MTLNKMFYLYPQNYIVELKKMYEMYKYYNSNDVVYTVSKGTQRHKGNTNKTGTNATI